MLLGASALLLAGCGGEEYPVPASEAIYTLSAVGTPAGLYPLPIGLEGIQVDFDTVLDQNFVKWRFSHDGEDLGTIFAQVEPNGETKSTVRVSYADGTAPDENWNNGKIRGLLERQVQQLVVEAVDAKFEKRPFDKEVKRRVNMETAQASIGTMFKEVDASMNKHIANEKEAKRVAESVRTINPDQFSKPTTDLSKFN
jgi:hypothetical protein